MQQVMDQATKNFRDAMDGAEATPVANVRVQRWINRQARLRTGVLASSATSMVRAMPRHIRHLFQGTTDQKGKLTLSSKAWKVYQGVYKKAHQGKREMARRVRNGQAKPLGQRQSAVF